MSATLDVHEGPAIEWQDDDVVRQLDWPFAYRVDSVLRELGVAVQNYTPMRPSDPIRAGGEYTQLHVRKASGAEALARAIVDRFGRNVQFAEMVVPANGVVCATWQRSGQVWVRHVIAYLPQDDTLRQRWDVLVKAVGL